MARIVLTDQTWDLPQPGSGIRIPLAPGHFWCRGSALSALRRVRRSTSTEALQTGDAGRARVQLFIGGGTPNMTSGHAAADQAGARPYLRRTGERLIDFPMVS
jgi:hypothetical protein